MVSAAMHYVRFWISSVTTILLKQQFTRGDEIYIFNLYIYMPISMSISKYENLYLSNIYVLYVMHIISTYSGYIHILYILHIIYIIYILYNIYILYIYNYIYDQKHPTLLPFYDFVTVSHLFPNKMSSVGGRQSK